MSVARLPTHSLSGWDDSNFAAGGTLQLDEVSEVPLSTQAKLLRALEEQEIQRVGSNKTIKTNVRIIATSNRDLRDEVAKGRFRLDLYHRLNVIEIKVPALRDRPKDIPLLVMHFVDKYKFENPLRIQGLTKSAMQRVCRLLVARQCSRAAQPDSSCLYSHTSPDD